MLILDLRAVGEKFYAVRKKYGMTQLEVATEAEISDRTYSELERGIANVRIETVLKVCAALHITPDQVLTDDGGLATAREEDILARLHACSPKDKETALRLLDTFLRSVGKGE